MNRPYKIETNDTAGVSKDEIIEVLNINSDELYALQDAVISLQEELKELKKEEY